MGGEAKFPMRLGRRFSRAALLPAHVSGLDPTPSRLVVEDLIFGVLPFTTIHEGFAVDTDPALEVITVFQSALQAADSNALTIVNAVTEHVSLDATALASIALTLNERFDLDVRIVTVLQVLLTETATFTDTHEAVPVKTVVVADTLQLLGVAEGFAAALALISEGLALVDMARSVHDATINDTLAFADSLDAKLSAFETLVSSVALADSVTALAVVTALVSEGVALADEATGLGRFIAVINEGLEFSIGFIFQGEPYLGVSISVDNPTRAVSEYSGYDFNSLAVFDEAVYGASADGLERLDGADDAGSAIEWHVRTALLKLGDGRPFRIEKAYVQHTTRGRLLLTVHTIERDQEGASKRIEYVYELVDPSSTGQLRAGRFPVGRGLDSMFMAFELRSVDLATLDDTIEELSLRPIILKPRIK